MSRPIMTGLKSGIGSTARATIQTAFEGITGQTYETTGTDLLGYTNVSFPTTYKPIETDIKMVSYYDEHAWQTETGYNFNDLTAFHAQGLTKGMMTGMLSRNIETNDWLKSVNYYDYKGRLIQSFFKNHKGNIERSETQYRFNGEVLKFRIDHEGINEIYDYELDHLGRKKSFRHTLNGTLKNVAKYEQDEIGRLKTKKLSPTNDIGTQASGEWNNINVWLNGSVPSVNDHVFINESHTITIPYGQAGSAGSLFLGGVLNNYGALKLGVLPSTAGESELQTVDYAYHIRGLRGINLDASGNLTNKLFSMKLSYETANFFDGNIGKQEWKSNIDNVSRSYTYTYDGASRIKTGLYASEKVGENYSLNNVTYDLNGNITNLSRNGWKSDNTFGLVDNLNYTYNSNSNKIQKVDDASNETASFADASGNDYTYALDGSLISDENKGISVIEYNYLKKPRRIVKGEVEILYQYDATGRKLRETIGSNFTDYLGNIIKKNDALYQIAHDEGRIIDGEYEYNIKDHLGNLRVAFRDSLGIAKITQANSYGVFGENLATLSYLKQSWKVDKFKFTGKEELSETGFTDFGARLYDNLVPRFITIDPLAEISRRFSPYTYANDNPVRFIDPDGMATDEHYEGAEAQERFREEKERNDDNDKGKKTQTEEQRLSEIVTIRGQKYHKNTSNLFATVGNKINSFFGGDPDYFVEHKPYDRVEEAMLQEYQAGAVGFVAGGVIGKAVGRGLGAIISNSKVSAVGALWAQKTFSRTFGEGGAFAGETVESVASALRSGRLSAADVPINVIVRNGETLILNTRSSVALMEAGIPRSAWNVLNQTGVTSFENMLTGQLARNGLTSGTNVIRQSGTQIIITY